MASYCPSRPLGWLAAPAGDGPSRAPALGGRLGRPGPLMSPSTRNFAAACAALFTLGLAACSDAEPSRPQETPGGSSAPPLEGIGSLASWSAISRGATPSELLIFPEQLTTNPDSECFDRYTARVESRTAAGLTIALIRQSERPRDFECAGGAQVGPPVVVALDAPVCGREAHRRSLGPSRATRTQGHVRDSTGQASAHTSGNR